MTDTQNILLPIQDEFNRYSDLFAATLRSDKPLLGEVLDYVSSKKGKQLRPLLVMLAAKLCREVSDKTLLTAVTMELVHTASLIHDDVVDESPMRRGMQSVHTRWTNKVAVLVGDYILSKVIENVASLRNTRILSIVSGLASTLSEGELLQLHANSSMWITEEQYYDIISRKTACLFAACMEAGAESAGGSMRQTTALKQFGWHLGMCFQLKDDVLDYSDSEDLGKPTMNDIRDGKVTLPLLIATQRAPENETQEIKQLALQLSSASQSGSRQAEEQIKSFVMRYEGVRYAYKQMSLHKEKAEKCLDIFRTSKVKESLIQLLNYSVNRIY